MTARGPGAFLHGVRPDSCCRDPAQGRSDVCVRHTAMTVALRAVKVDTFWLQVQERIVISTPRRR